MNTVWTCAQGHRWDHFESDADAQTTDFGKCPVCGQAGKESTINPAEYSIGTDELPPRPVRMPQEVTTVHISEIDEAAKSWAQDSGYEVLEELGRGGMGVVYKARQRSLNRLVALKMVLSGGHASSGELKRFRTEAEAIASLQHPHIVHIYDVTVHDNHPCFSMEFVDGGNLADRIGKSPLPPSDAAELAVLIARAVHAAHERGIIHRDLKPANVLLTKDGTPKITDFGLAKFLDQQEGQTRFGDLMGTPNYMSPEQAEGHLKAIGRQTDVYALGAMLYEMLTGQPPFRGENHRQTMKQVLFDEPQPPTLLKPEIPGELNRICLKCLRKDPGERYPTAKALADDLQQWLLEPGKAEPSTLRGQDTSLNRNRRLSLGFNLTKAGRSMQLGCSLTVSLVLLIGFVGIGSFVIPQFFWPGINDHHAQPKRQEGSWEIFTITEKQGEIFHRIAFPTADVGYAVSRNAVYKSQDGGKNWTKLAHPNPGRVYFLYFQNTQIGWLGTDQLHFTEDGGQSWSEMALGNEKISALSALALRENGWA